MGDEVHALLDYRGGRFHPLVTLRDDMRSEVAVVVPDLYWHPHSRSISSMTKRLPVPVAKFI